VKLEKEKENHRISFILQPYKTFHHIIEMSTILCTIFSKYLNMLDIMISKHGMLQEV